MTFDQVRLHVRKSPLSESYGGNIDLRPAFDPQWAIFRHDLAGIFCHRADGLTLNQVDVRWDADMPEYYNHALWCEQTDRVVIDGFRGRQPGPATDARRSCWTRSAASRSATRRRPRARPHSCGIAT